MTYKLIAAGPSIPPHSSETTQDISPGPSTPTQGSKPTVTSPFTPYEEYRFAPAQRKISNFYKRYNRIDIRDRGYDQKLTTLINSSDPAQSGLSDRKEEKAYKLILKVTRFSNLSDQNRTLAAQLALLNNNRDLFNKIFKAGLSASCDDLLPYANRSGNQEMVKIAKAIGYSI